MSKKKRHIHASWAIAPVLIIVAAFFIWKCVLNVRVAPVPTLHPPVKAIPAASSTPPVQRRADPILNSIHPVITPGTAHVIAASPKVFAYAHGTAEADGRFFIGMSNKSGNIYPSNQLTIFGDPGNLARPILITLPDEGDIQTMVSDPKNDRVYFQLSNNSALKLFSINPHTYAISTIISTTSVNAGRKPAITTDGTYIYGITDSDKKPSTIYKVRIADGQLTMSSNGHIPDGHSAAIGVYDSKVELYFDGGSSNTFEKVDGETLASIATVNGAPCGMSDDMAYVRTGDTGGYVYIGCEIVPYGLRMRTNDMKVERFSLPGGSFGLFSIAGDIYNAAQDGFIDVFPGGDLTQLERYRVTDDQPHFDTRGQDLEVNELLYSPSRQSLYFTAWLGIPGLYKVATSTP